MRKFFNSLHSRLILGLALAAIPGFVIIASYALHERDLAIEEMQHKVVMNAQRIAMDQQRTLHSARAFFQRLATFSEILDPTSSECDSLLAEFSALAGGDYINLGIAQVDGTLACSASPLIEPVNLSEQDYFQRARQTGELTVSPFQPEPVTGVTSLNLVFPLFEAGSNEVSGFIVGGISQDLILGHIGAHRPPPREALYLTDHEEAILAVFPEEDELIGRPFSSVQTSVSDGIPASLQGSSVLKDSKGVHQLFAFRDFRGPDGELLFRVNAGITYEQELSDIDSKLLQSVMLMMVFFVLVLLLAHWSLQKTLINPLSYLIKQTKELQLGKSLMRRTKKGVTELVELQNNFDLMAKTRLSAEQKLKDSQAHLQDSETRLARHLQNTPLGCISWDTDYNCTAWNESAESIFGYSAKEAIGRHVSELILSPEGLDKKEFYKFSYDDKLGGNQRRESLTKSGQRVTCDWYYSPNMDLEGEVSSVTSFVHDITESRRNQRVLDRYFEQSINLNLIAGTNGVIYRVNKSWKLQLGYNSNELIDQHLADFIHPDDLASYGHELSRLLNTKESLSIECRFQHKSGEYRLLAWSAVASGEDQLIYAVAHDITEEKQLQSELNLAASVFSHAKEGIMITDSKGQIVQVNDSFVEITGYSRNQVMGKNPNILSSRRHSSEFYAEMWHSLKIKGFWSGEIWNKRRNGDTYPEMLTISSVYNALGEVQNYVALFTDISTLKEHQQQLEFIAHYDVLTQLPNRVLLADRLSQAMTLCQRNDSSLAVVFLDLDGFKTINDRYGHQVGDKLLVALAKRMQETLRECDTLSRIGGDEFVAVLSELKTLEDCEPILERLLSSASDPVIVDDTLLQVSASIGVTIYPQDVGDAEQLLRHADQAMYMAKLEGKNRFNLFDPQQDNAVKVHRDSLENIRHALKQNEFVLFYQPKVNMITGEVIGAEALIRWLHPERGVIPPMEFLPVIEGHQLSIEVGEWVIDTALCQIAQWQSMELHIPVSVNVSALQLQQDGFEESLMRLFAAHPEVNPRHLELEVLETSALSDINNVTEVMHACSLLGVTFALDDFGTGYSSLTYLRRLPAQSIKIDQSFIRDMLEDLDDLAIVEGVVGLAKTFQRETIAEGVETVAHGTRLLELGCHLAQGYGIARPMPAADIPAWVEGWRPDVAWSGANS